MNPEDITPTRTIREGFRWLPAAIITTLLAFAVVAILVVVGAHLGWWLQKQSIQHGYSNTTSSQAYQASLIKEMQHK